MISTNVDAVAALPGSEERSREQLSQIGDGFEPLLVAIERMHRYQEALQQENRSLHAALEALRSGAGIAVVIDGTPFTLRR